MFRNMFVGGVTEVEVKTPEEALQTYFKVITKCFKFKSDMLRYFYINHQI